MWFRGPQALDDSSGSVEWYAEIVLISGVGFREEFHDDSLLAVQVAAPHKQRELATIHIDLKDNATGGRKRLTLSRCARFK